MPASVFASIRPAFRASALALALAAAFTSVGTLAQAPPPPKPAASDAKPSDSGMDAPLFYQLLVGELELQRGEPGTAFQVMLDAARRTNDETLFRRSVNIAVQGRAGNEALSAAKAWRTALPQSQEAKQTQVQLLTALGQLAEVPEPLVAWMSNATLPGQVAMLDSLPRLLRTQAPKALDAMAPALSTLRDDAQASPKQRALAAAAMGELALIAQNPALARNQFGQALIEMPDNPLPRWLAVDLMRWAPEAESLVTPAIAADPELRLAYARALARDNRSNEALQQFQQLIGLQPDQSAHLYAVASLELELRHPNAALAAVETYLQRLQAEAPTPQQDTARASALLIQAQALEQLRNYPAALAALDAIKEDDRAFEVNYRRAAIEARQGQLSKARARIQALPADTPETVQRRLLAETQLLRENGDWRGAHALLGEALKGEGASKADLLYEHAMSAERLGQFDLMEQQLRRVMELEPKHHHAYNALGYSLADRGERLPEARELIERAIELGGHEPFLVDSLGWIAFRQGQVDEAERLLRQAYQARPDAEIGAHLGEVLWQRGAKDEARQILDQASQRDAENPALRATRKRLGLR